MRSSNQTGRTSGKTSKQVGLKPLSVMGITIIVVALLVLSVFVFSAFTGFNKRNPTVLFYGVESNFPKTSMSNTLYAAGFNYEIMDSIDELDPDESYVIAAIGEYSIDCLEAYSGNDNVLGFVLICPDYADGQSFDGLSSTYPSKHIAIFSGKDNASKITDFQDARIIYERLSGDDTLYGTPVKRGGIFASDCFINNSQNRYLSLSSFRYNSDDAILFSPMFQNELAGYLGVTYQNDTIKDISFGRINTWFVMIVLSLFAILLGEFIYLSLLPVVMSDNAQGKLPIEEKISVGIVGGVALASVILVIAFSLAENLHKYIIICMMLMPLFFLLCMTLSRIKFILSRTDKAFRPRGDFKRPLFMAFTSALALVLCFTAFGDLGIRYDIPESAVAAGCFMLTSILASALIYADRKSRSMQMGGCSLFGNIICMPITLVPSVFALIYGLIFRMSEIVTSGVGGILVIVLPFIFVLPLRRHSDNYFIPGMLYGFVYTLSLMLIA